MEKKSNIAFKESPNAASEVVHILHPFVKKWFFNRFKDFSLPQLFGVLEIHSRNNVLISAPTGATKTLTGFLSILNELVDHADKGTLQDKVYAIYISPLKALNNDIEKNLNEPLKEIEALAGKPLGIRVGVRTGDTTASDRAKMSKRPPHILITTPESLAILLAAPKFREHLKSVEWCIVDEIHALAENKRGVHFSLSLERLQFLTPSMCRIGLSATVAPLDEIAQYLVGSRNCLIIDVRFLKDINFQVMSPVDNLIETSPSVAHFEMYALIDKLIHEHKTTLIFTNTRAATERVVDHLKTKFPKKYAGLVDKENNPDEQAQRSLIGAHHGSLSKRLRFAIEESLRKGQLKAVVCSTSLELGIDIGYIDLVICLGSPKSVARFLQRAGRSGHKLHETVKARMIVMDRDDLVECAALMKAAIEKKIDRVHIPSMALDVLAQHILGMAIEQVWDEDDAFKLIKQSFCYRDLTRKDFDQLLAYLAGEFVDLEDRHVYAKIWREAGKFGKRGKLVRVLYMTNIGTIPDESFYTVKIGNETVGMLDEGFVERLRPGDVFVLGGETYMFKFTRGMVAQVSGSVNRPPTVPHWVSEMLPLSYDLSLIIGRFRRLMEEHLKKDNKSETLKFINEHLYVDDKAASAIFSYFKEQFDYCGHIPSDKKIIVEYVKSDRDEKIIFHSLFGRRVNDCLSRAIAFALSKKEHKDVEIGINDNGFYISGGKKLRVLDALRLLDSGKLDVVMNFAVEKSEVFKRRFRHCASRALMILRSYMGRQKSVGKQQMSANLLMSALKRIDPNFSILREAKRECIEDVMDIGNAKEVLKGIEDGKIKLVEIESSTPSPFAFNLAIQGYADILKIEDKFEFLHRMHEQVLAKISGKPVHNPKMNMSQYMQKAKGEKNEFKELLRREAWNLKSIPKRAKAELVRVIDGERRDIDPKFIAGIEEQRVDIEASWPVELRKFLFTVLPELKQGEFSYEDFWSKQEAEEEKNKEELKFKLYEQFNNAAKRLKVDPQIRYDVYKLIDGDSKIRSDTLAWLKAFASSNVPVYWKDDIAQFLVKKYNELK